MPEPDPWQGATPLTSLAIDHIGIVVPDIAPVVARFRGHGLKVSDGEALQGDSGPLGQTSAHCVFPNAYVEISAPVAGSGNHLEPYLAQGPGIRILALASGDIEADHAWFDARRLAAGPPRGAHRVVRLSTGDATARFRWFPVAEVLPGALVAVVEHRDRPTVFAREFTDHPCEADRLQDVLFGRVPHELANEKEPDGGAFPAVWLNEALEESIAGFTIGGAQPFREQADGFALRCVQ